MTTSLKTVRSFDSVKVRSGRFVNVGHEVVNFRRSAVVQGTRQIDGFLLVQETRGTDLVPGSTWWANPSLCD